MDKPCCRCGLHPRRSRTAPYCRDCSNAVKRTPAYRLQAQVRTYGLTKADYFRMLADQDARCAICSRPSPDKPLCIDHDHTKSGPSSVRGLLCSPCNSALGRFGESTEVIARAAAYLERDPIAWMKQFEPKPVGVARQCTRCKEWKGLDRFAIRGGTSQLTRRCDDCKEEFKIPQAQRVRLTKYDLTVRRYSALLVAQDHRCAICLRPQEKPYVDHCHRTQRVCGLLCLDCNLGIGLLGDSPELAKRAIEYLKRFNGS